MGRGQFVRKLAVYGLLGIALIILLIVTLLPLSIRIYALNWLEREGHDAHFEHLSIAPLAGRLEIGGFATRSPEGRQLVVDTLVVDVALAPLMVGNISVDNLELSGVKLDVDRGPSSLKLAGIELPMSSSDKVEAASEDGGAESDLVVSIDSLLLDDIELCSRAIDTEERAHHCVSVKNFTLDQTMTLSLSDSIAGNLDVSLGEFSIEDKGLGAVPIRLNNLVVEGVAFEIANADARSTDQCERLSLQIESFGIGRLSLLPISQPREQLADRTGWDSLMLSGLSVCQSLSTLDVVLNSWQLTSPAAAIQRVDDVLDLDRFLTSFNGQVFPESRSSDASQTLAAPDASSTPSSSANSAMESISLDVQSFEVTGFEGFWYDQSNIVVPMAETVVSSASHKSAAVDSVNGDDALAHQGESPLTRSPLISVNVGKVLIDGRACGLKEAQGVAKASHCVALSLDVERIAASQKGSAELMIDSITLSDLEITDRLLGNDLLSLKAFSVDHLQLRDNQFLARQVGLDDLFVAEYPLPVENEASLAKQLVHLNEFRIDDTVFDMTRQAISIDAIVFDQLDIVAERAESGAFPALQSFESLNFYLGQAAKNEAPQDESSEQTEEIDPEIEESSPINLTLNRLQASKPVRIQWIDQGVKPAVKENLVINTLSIEGVNSSDDSQMADVEFSALLGDSGIIDLSGGIQPFSEKINGRLKGKVQHINMLTYSPYVREASGYQIQRGLLNHDISIGIEENQLDVKTDTLLSKFYLASEPDEDSGETSENIPVGLALNLLRDSNDDIRLKMPVTGSIDDPSFSLNHVFGVVFRKTLTTAVVNYYTPFGLVNLASAAVSSATKLRFDDVQFTPATDEIAAASSDQLAKLAELLSAKQQLSMSFCPQVTQPDFLALTGMSEIPPEWQPSDDLKAQLLELGNQRFSVVRERLMAQKVGAGQVIACQPELLIKSAQSPAVKVVL